MLWLFFLTFSFLPRTRHLSPGAPSEECTGIALWHIFLRDGIQVERVYVTIENTRGAPLGPRVLHVIPRLHAVSWLPNFNLRFLKYITVGANAERPNDTDLKHHLHHRIDLHACPLSRKSLLFTSYSLHWAEALQGRPPAMP